MLARGSTARRSSPQRSRDHRRLLAAGAAARSGSSLAPDAFVAPGRSTAPTRVCGRSPPRFPSAGPEARRRRGGRPRHQHVPHGRAADDHPALLANTAVGRRPMQDIHRRAAGGVEPPDRCARPPRLAVLARDGDLSGTAALAELARVFTGRTLRKRSCSCRRAAARRERRRLRLARAPGGPVDAVVVLGDLARRACVGR